MVHGFDWCFTHGAAFRNQRFKWFLGISQNGFVQVVLVFKMPVDRPSATASLFGNTAQRSEGITIPAEQLQCGFENRLASLLSIFLGTTHSWLCSPAYSEVGGWCSVRLSKTVRSHGWRSPSAPWMGRRSVFWRAEPNTNPTQKPTKKGTSNRALSCLTRQAMTANQISPSAAICM